MSTEKKRAVALHYDGRDAPRVTAKGEQEVAEQIIRIAKEHNIPLQEDDNLTALLAKVELNEAIPRELYLAVAQLLCFLYHITGKTPEDYTG